MLHPTIYQDAARSGQESLPQSRDGNLKTEEWWPSVWGQVKSPVFKYGTSLLDCGTAHGQAQREALVTLEACNRLVKSADVSNKDITLENDDGSKNEQAVELHLRTNESNVEQTFIPLLRACSSFEALGDGQWLHRQIIERGLETDPYICCTLIDMYVKCGNLEKAESAFESHPTKLVETWNALISGYTHHQRCYEGLKLFEKMQQEGVEPSRVTFLCVLKACSNEADLDEGRRIHDCLIESGFEFAMFIENALIDMYVKCASLDDAHAVFVRSSRPDATSFNTLIGGYAEDGNVKPALVLFRHMQVKGISYDEITFVCILKACCTSGSLSHGQHIHAKVVEFGLELDDEHVGNSLLHMYTCCESFEDAKILFERMRSQSVVTWTTLIAGYTQSGQGVDALELLGQMRHQGVEPNEVTFISIVKGCSSILALEMGRSVHENLIEGGLDGSLCIGNALIDMYGKCGNLEDATTLFLRMPSRNVVTWTALIAGYSQYGRAQEAMLYFDRMQNEGLHPNPVTFAALLNACANRDALNQGRSVHACIIEHGLEYDTYIGNSLVDMYFECQSSDDGVVVFNKMPQRGVVTWNILVTGYVQHGKHLQALQSYRQMHLEGLVQPDPVTFVSALKSCVGMEDLYQGVLIHAHIIRSNFLLDTSVGSSLIEMYIRCEHLEDACRVFSSLPERNAVTWNVLLKGFVDARHGNKTLELFLLMQEDGLKPDAVTLLCTMKACSSIGALQQGYLLHIDSVQRGLDIDLSIGNSLVSMYSSCGSMSEAQAVFEKMPMRDRISWSTLITGYAQHNDCSEALRCYESMLEYGVQPDEIILVCVLSACSRGGFIDEGFTHFKSMRDSLGLQPTVEHYNPLVDLLGGVGALHEAEDLMETLPFKKNMVGWVTLLAASRDHSNQGIARRCFDHVVEIDPANASAYVIMSNIYTRAGLLEEAQSVEELRRLANAWKKPAKAYIEIDNRVHEFIVGDKTHPQRDAIYTKLNALNARLKEEGYRPKLDLVLNFTAEEDKEKALCGHSEKLAIAFGLISSSPFTTLRVSKNLRMCDDCHVATKLISRVEMRNIMVKDSYCIHQFQKGICSCEA